MLEGRKIMHFYKILGISLAIIISASPSIAFSHGGGLDSYGCHHNRKAGGYHCHRGEFKGQSFPSKEEMLKAKKKGK